MEAINDAANEAAARTAAFITEARRDSANESHADYVQSS